MKHKLTAVAGATKENKTGSWRNRRPVIDHARCIACGTCTRCCPEGCTFPVGEQALQGKIFYEVDLDYCKGCGICAAECPVKCIAMVDEDK
jgi:pyruvate ferredoxin oxidoreductase delta subunit